MANSLSKTKKPDIESFHNITIESSSIFKQAANSDHEGFPTSTGRNCEYLSYGRKRSAFPHGIVSEFDFNNSRSSCVETSNKMYPSKLVYLDTKWNSSPCLGQSLNAARWRSRLSQTSAKIPREESVRLPESPGPSRIRTHSCLSTPVNHSIGLEFPKQTPIMVQAQSFPLVSRPTQPVMFTKPKMSRTMSAGRNTTYKARAGSVHSIERRTTDNNPREKKEDQLSRPFSEVKIEDSVIFINNGKALDLRKDKRGGKQKLKTAEVVNSKSYREFQESMQKFEDAQLSLKGELSAKPKNFEKQQQFLNEHVQTQLMDLFSSVKEKRKMKKGEKYRC